MFRVEAVRQVPTNGTMAGGFCLDTVDILANDQVFGECLKT